MTLESLNNPNLYKGPNSSKAFNERNQSMIRDINRLYALLNKNEKDIVKNMDIVLRENFFLQNSVSQLNSEVARLEKILTEQSESFGDEVYSILLENFYNSENIANGESDVASQIDRTHGVVTPLPTNISSKLSYETETGQVILPKGLEVFLKEAKDTDRDYTMTAEEAWTTASGISRPSLPSTAMSAGSPMRQTCASGAWSCWRRISGSSVA